MKSGLNFVAAAVAGFFVLVGTTIFTVDQLAHVTSVDKQYLVATRMIQIAFLGTRQEP